jgi:hypothetical protein
VVGHDLGSVERQDGVEDASPKHNGWMKSKGGERVRSRKLQANLFDSFLIHILRLFGSVFEPIT